jgi:hypothetical protein
MMTVKVGDLIRMRSFTTHQPEVQLTFKAVNKNTVYVFMLMGTEPIDGSRPLDGMAVLDGLGWKPKKGMT